MYLKKFFLSIWSIIVLSLLPQVISADESYHGPSCISEFCFSFSSIKKEALVNRYGRGYSNNKQFPFYCYQASENVFVHFRAYHGEEQDILSIFVSRMPNCDQNVKPKINFPELRTAEGLALGDSYDKVIRLYGKPDFITKADGTEKIGLPFNEARNSQPFGDKVLLYRGKDDPLHSRIYIKDEKVSAISISRFP